MTDLYGIVIKYEGWLNETKLLERGYGELQVTYDL